MIIFLSATMDNKLHLSLDCNRSVYRFIQICHAFTWLHLWAVLIQIDSITSNINIQNVVSIQFVLQFQKDDNFPFFALFSDSFNDSHCMDISLTRLPPTKKIKKSWETFKAGTKVKQWLKEKFTIWNEVFSAQTHLGVWDPVWKCLLIDPELNITQGIRRLLCQQRS